MRISIAMAAFNGAKHISEQLESFAKQSLQPNELIICDDGSIDETIEIIYNFIEIAPFEVKLIKNTDNLGHVQNFAKAASLCSGDIVFLSDQDDKWFSNKIESVVKVFLENPRCWTVIHDGELTDSELTPSGQTKMSQIRRGYGSTENISTGALSAVKQELLKYALPIPSDIAAHDTWLHQVALLLPTRRVVLDRTLQYIRRHDSNTSSWVVNSSKKISRLDVILSQANSASAHDYTDRLRINIGVTKSAQRMRGELTNLTDLCVIKRAEARLMTERKAIYSRQLLVESSWFKRKLYSIYMLMSGHYTHFNGVRSFIRDIIR